MKKITINCLLTFCMFLSTLKVYSQFPGSSFEQQNRSLLISNIGSSALVSGIGAVINKKRGQKGVMTFIKGFLIGGAGGFLKYQGKNIVHNIYTKENLSYNLYAKLVFSMGESICENATANRHPLSRWHINYLVGRFDLRIQKRKASFHARFDPIPLLSLTYNLIKGHKLDIPLTLQSGDFVLFSKGPLDMKSGKALGLAYPGLMVVDKKYFDTLNPIFRNKELFHVYAHEKAHNLQVNNFSLSITDIIGDENKEIDGPVFINPSFILHNLLYRLEGRKSIDKYYRNYFEFEAEFFAKKQQVYIR